jgi:aryl-alcohol dehydrogenase-like predicted oxidoreductase
MEIRGAVQREEFTMTANVNLGLGIIGIGREWGYAKSDIPREEEAIRFLEEALRLGIYFYDTAPAYGSSEGRFGKFLRSLDTESRDKIIVATKFGEHWDDVNNCSFVDHSYQALCKSIDQSIDRLGRIDILQLHKSNPQVLGSQELFDAIDYAREKGIRTFGASVSDIESGMMVCSSKIFSAIQLPYNVANTGMEKVIDAAIANNKYLIINRPFNMGKLLYENVHDANTYALMIEYYNFILAKQFKGVILTGTKSIQHLIENIGAYQSASADEIR